MSFLIQTPSQLATHLRALRMAQGWSQQQLGVKLGLSQTRIARIEKDPLNVSVGQFLKVLCALDARMSVAIDSKTPDLSVVSGNLNTTEAGDTLGATGSVGFGNTDKSNQGDW
jgi:transcriptional regulator with XRE-family HTH domain